MKREIVLIYLVFIQAIFFTEVGCQERSTVAFDGGNICVNEDEWVKVLHDDFDGEELDTAAWWTYYPSNSDNPEPTTRFSRTSFEDESQQIFLDDNVVVQNGVLKISIKEEEATWMGATKPYTSGLIYSKKFFNYYSKFEMRAKVPCEEGVGSAFWIFGWSTEIDIFEINNGVDDEIKMSVHEFPSDGSGRLSNSASVPVANFCGVYRTYTAEYSAFKVDFLIDNEVVFTFPRYYHISGDPVLDCRVSPGLYLEHPNFPRFGDQINIIVSMGVGAGGDDNVEPNAKTNLPVIMEIDYISAFQLEPKNKSNLKIKDLMQAVPSPTTGLFKLRKADYVTILNLSSIKISSILGQDVLKVSYNGEDEVDIDISAEPIGVYIITFIDTSGAVISSIKILKN